MFLLLRAEVQGTLLLTLRFSMQMAPITTGSGQISGIVWKESIYSSFERTDGV